MIPVPSGVRVWLAVGHTDMRRGMNSLALQVQEKLGRDPTRAICMFLGGNAVTWSRFSGTTGSACRSTPSGSNGAGLSGRRRPMAQSRSPRRSSPICLTALTGGTQSEPGGQKQPAKSLSLTALGVRLIDSPFS